MNFDQYFPCIIAIVAFFILLTIFIYRIALRGDIKAFREGYKAALFTRGEIINDNDKAKIKEIYEKPSIIGCLLHANSWESGYKGALIARGWKPEDHDFQQLAANPYKERDAAIIIANSPNNK